MGRKNSERNSMKSIGIIWLYLEIYMLVIDDLTQFKHNEDKEDYEESEYTPIEWCVSKLLTGCCRNVWYRVKFRGKMQMIGVAYHA